MSTLHVPGARLHYETRGSGPLLLMIPGATGSADAFNAVANHLSEHLQVVTYDRRGFSRSVLNGPQNYELRLDTDADDALALIEHSGAERASVFGSSSGAIVALQLLTRHPSAVRTVIACEPPLVKQLSNGQEWLDVFLRLHGLYRQSGIQAALQEFREQVLTRSDRQPLARATDETNRSQAVANTLYWLEHELRQYPAVEIDIERLTTHVARIHLAVGRESAGYPAHDSTVVLADRLGTDVIALRGGHLGFVSQPAEFARELSDTLVPYEPDVSTT